MGQSSSTMCTPLQTVESAPTHAHNDLPLATMQSTSDQSESQFQSVPTEPLSESLPLSSRASVEASLEAEASSKRSTKSSRSLGGIVRRARSMLRRNSTVPLASTSATGIVDVKPSTELETVCASPRTLGTGDELPALENPDLSDIESNGTANAFLPSNSSPLLGNVPVTVPEPQITRPLPSLTTPARRIVVQGTISSLPAPRNPMPRNLSQHPSTLSPPTYDSRSSIQAPSDDSDSDLPPLEAVEDSDDEFEDQPTTTPPHSLIPSRSNTSDSFSPATALAITSSLADQAALIARLLSVAAAATAASLLPGRISINGQTIPGFPGLDSGPGVYSALASDNHPTMPVALTRDGERDRTGPLNRVTSWRDRILRSRSRSSTLPPSGSLEEPPLLGSPREEGETQEGSTNPNATDANLSPLQSILRQALQAEFSSSSSPSSTDEATSRNESVSMNNTSSDSSEETTNPMPRPESNSSPSPTSEGSFERFLGDLQRDVSMAVLQSTSPLSEPNSTSETSLNRSPFSFFRMHRFRDRQLDPSGSLTDFAPITNSPTGSNSTSDETLAVDTSLPVGIPLGENAPALSIPTTLPRPPSNLAVVPVLLVGVRSIDPGESPSFPLLTPTLPSPSDVEPTSDSTVRVENAESPDSPLDGTVPHNETHESAPPTVNTPSEVNTPNLSSSRQWLIWIAAGVYPTSHPLLSMPALLSGFEGQAGYEELLRLAELIGQHKPPTATRSEIERSGLKIVKGSELGELLEDAQVRSNTAERCLVCLEDYSDEDDLRVMNCRHVFHRDCVDHWLSVGSNNCPACRTQGVSKDENDNKDQVATSNDFTTPIA